MLSAHDEVMVEMIAQAIAQFVREAPTWADAGYLWYRPSGGGHAGKLACAPDSPGEGWELACAERIPLWSTRETLQLWIIARVGRLPVLNPCSYCGPGDCRGSARTANERDLARFDAAHKRQREELRQAQGVTHA